MVRKTDKFATAHRRIPGLRPRTGRARRLAAEFDDLEGRLLLSGIAPASSSGATAAYLQLPLAFEINSGQTASEVNYLAHGAGYTLFLTPDAAVFNLLPAAGDATGAVLRMQVVGGSAAAAPTGLQPLPGESNAFIGNDPSQWHTGIANYGRVEYQNVYPGVNLDYYGNQGQLEYDFVVAPGANPGQIAVQYQGADSLSLDGQGNLVVATAGGDVTVNTPNLYQTVNGVRQSVSGSFVLLGNDEVGFNVGTYDPTLPLVIDPTLTYSTFLGGSLGDQAFAVALDPSGNAYVTGETGSNDFPTTTGAYSTLLNQSGVPGNTVTDAFVTKFNTSGQLVYSTFLGGSSDDHGTGIAVDQFGYAYICGWTSQSNNYPTTPGAFQTAYNHGQDGFVTKLSQDGKSLVYSTYLGGSADDEPHAIAVDGSGNAYIAGDTWSTDFPTKNPIQGGVPNSYDDGFLTKLNTTGTALVYSTYLRGSLMDAATGVAVDPQNEAIVVGYTTSTNFPTTANAFQTTRGGNPAQNVTNTFVTKVNAAGTGYVYSTYLGGSVGVIFAASNGGAAVATDAAGDAYVAGSTSDPDFPTTNDAAQQVFNGTDKYGLSDAYVAKFNPTGGLTYSTYLGGGGLNTSDGATAIAVDSQGYAYVTGYTADTTTPFPINFPIQTTPGQPASYTKPGDYDAFVTRVTPDGSSFDYSSYLGGQTYDYGRGIAVDAQGNVTVVGVTRSKASAGGGTPSTFPTLNAIKSTPPSATIGDQDGFVSRISLTEPGAGTFYFPFQTYETTEAGSFITIQVDRRDGDATAATIHYAMSDGTAKNGTNYQTQSGTLSFPAGAHEETFTIPILDDHVNDGTPFLVFHLALSSPTGGATLDNTASTADVHVYDIETTNTNNDLYDNAIPIAGTSATAQGNNLTATTNTGGDDVFDYPVTDGKSTTSPKNAGGNSVWWVWAAPTSGLTTIDTSGSNFDTLLTVFSYGHMIENDDAPGVSDGTSKVTFMAHAGLVYRICVQGYNPGVSPATGNITLHVNEVSTSTLQLGAAAYSVNENAGSITIPISRVGGSGAVSVQFSTSGGTATPNTDYVPITNQTVSWAAGDNSTKYVTITILDPHIAGGSKTVNLVLSNPTGGATLGSPNTAVLTINDNETHGTVQLDTATYTVNENAGSIDISVTRANGSFGAASVQLSTGGGTATPNVDYTPVNQTINWADGDAATKTVTIPILDPHLYSGSKTVNITLSSASGATLGSPSTSVLTILDNDTPPATGTALSLVSANIAGTDSAALGATLPSVSANGQYVAFQSSSFSGYVLPGPSDLVQGLTVANALSNIYLRNVATNTTTCLSLSNQTSNTTANNISQYPIISSDGNTVVFLSKATDLTANDNNVNNPNHNQNVFAWSRATGQVTLVSVNAVGTGPADYGVQDIGVSANGRFVTFDSAATNLVANSSGMNGVITNVYVRDLQAGKTILVSASTAGPNAGGDYPSNNPVISADGSTVAFDSTADNLNSTFTGSLSQHWQQLFASALNSSNDTITTTKLVSVNPAGTIAGSGNSVAPSLSNNGQSIAFQSRANNLVSISAAVPINVFARNLATNTTTMVSVNSAGTASGDNYSYAPQMSGDGSHVLFYSDASNLTTSATNGKENVYERNLTTSTTQLVSISTSGTSGGNNTSTLANQTFGNPAQKAYGQISDNGQYVVFESLATDLVPNFVQNSGGAPYGYDLYRRDTVAGTTTLVTHQLNTTVSGGNGASGTAAMTTDGLKIAFQSTATNLVSNDANGQTQVFENDLSPLVATTIAATAGTPQSAAVNTAFATALQATVTDQHGSPMSGVTVTFTAPSSGASGKFPGSLTSVTATTNASGVATAPTFTANGTTGSYTVTASVSGVATSASYSLTNTPTLTATSLTAVSGTGTYGGTATLTATLTANGTPLAGKTITFTLTQGGITTTVGSIATGANGVATLPGVSLTGFSAGTATSAVGASFAGDSTYGQSNGSGNLIVSKATPTFSSLASPKIVVGTASTVLSGQIAAGSVIPTGSVAITLNGVVQQASINATSGAFSSTFSTGALGTAGSPYTIAYAFAASTNFNAANGSGTLTVAAALPAPTVTLASANIAGTNSAAIGALFPSISADGRYVAFESGSFQGSLTPAPSDLVQGLTVQNDAPNVYLRDLVTKTTICLSVDRQSTTTTGNDDSRYPIISANGNTVVFLSNATDLTANDNNVNNPNHNQNVFAWNRTTGQITLVTVNYNGTGPANDPNPNQFGTAENIGVSANGRYIVYDSAATDLVPGITNINYTPNVYVYDLQTGTNILVSRNKAGTSIGNGSSVDPVISADGSTVAFDSLANNLDPNYTGIMPFTNYQVYVSTLNGSSDTVTATKLVSINPAGTTVGNGTSIAPSLNGNGQMLAFQSSSTNLVSTPNGGSYNDVYVRNLVTNTTQLVTVNQAGTATGDSSSFAPQMSGDGNHVLFYSLADNLTTNPTNGQTNVFERDLTTNTTQLVSINASGTGGGNGTSTLANQTYVNSFQQATAQISDNGQYVVFKSVATDLVPNFVQKNGGAPYGTDLYLRDTVSGTTTLVTHQLGTTTTGGTGLSGYGDLTPDGLKLAFQSAFPTAPDNMVSNDTYGQTQLFYVNLAPPVATAIAATAGTPQSAVVNTAFATALQATVTDQNGNAMSGVTVTFTAPTSGASGRFPGSLTSVTATTNASGVATAPTFTANGTTGSYTVTASVSGLATTASFSLTNTSATVATSLAAVSGTGTYGGTATLTATLTANGAPLAGKSVAFTVTLGSTTTPVGSATTGANGVATLSGVSLSGFNAGTATNAVGASFAGDSTYAPSNGSGNLTVNKATPTFSALASPTITVGTASTVLSGQIAAGSVIPTGNVAITLNGVVQQASINATTGAFSSTFSTGALGTAGSPYTIAYAFAANTNFNAVNGSGSLTVTSTQPTKPNAPMLSAASDTGVSPSDGITSHNGSTSATLIYTVTGIGPANGFVQLYDATNAANLIPLGDPVQAVGGNATVTLAGGRNLPLADGIHQIAAASEATSGGTPSALSNPTPITIQTSVTISDSNPKNGTVVTALPGGVVTLTFSHPLAGLTNGGPALGPSDPYGIFLLARGPAGVFTAPGTSTSTPGYYLGNLPLHTNATYTVNGNGASTITLTPTIPFSTDVYLVSITLSDFSDLAGNTLTDPSGGGYRSFLLQLPPVNNQALKVTTVTTYNGATVVANNAIVQPDTLAIAFNRPLYGPSVTTSNVQLLAQAGSTYTVVPSVPAYSPTTNTIYLTPTAQLHPGTLYLIRVAGKDTPSTPSNKYVSDDQGYGNPGNPLGATFYDTFTVTTNPASPGTGPLNVATVTGGVPALLPAANVVWTKPMGYASIGFTEAVNLSTIGRYSVMLVPETVPPGPVPLAPNIPLNSSLAFNPNTNQLIVVPTALTGNNLLYVYSLSAFQGHDGSPLLNNAGNPAGVDVPPDIHYPPYYQTFLLATGSSHVLERTSGQGGSAGTLPTAALTAPADMAPRHSAPADGAHRVALLGGARHPARRGWGVFFDVAQWGKARFRLLRGASTE